MGNCNGFCMSSSVDDKPKKITANEVQGVLNEKNELFREGAMYEDQYYDQTGGQQNKKLS